jgi:hypothetical protein
MSFWKSLGKILKVAAPFMALIPGIGTIGALLASTAAGALGGGLEKGKISGAGPGALEGAIGGVAGGLGKAALGAKGLAKAALTVGAGAAGKVASQMGVPVDAGMSAGPQTPAGPTTPQPAGSAASGPSAQNENDYMSPAAIQEMGLSAPNIPTVADKAAAGPPAQETAGGSWLGKIGDWVTKHPDVILAGANTLGAGLEGSRARSILNNEMNQSNAGYAAGTALVNKPATEPRLSAEYYGAYSPARMKVAGARP